MIPGMRTFLPSEMASTSHFAQRRKSQGLGGLTGLNSGAHVRTEIYLFSTISMARPPKTQIMNEDWKPILVTASTASSSLVAVWPVLCGICPLRAYRRVSRSSARSRVSNPVPRMVTHLLTKGSGDIDSRLTTKLNDDSFWLFQISRHLSHLQMSMVQSRFTIQRSRLKLSL